MARGAMLIEITSFWEAAFWALYIFWMLGLVCFAFLCNQGEIMEDENEEDEIFESDEVFEEEEIWTLDDELKDRGLSRGMF